MNQLTSETADLSHPAKEALTLPCDNRYRTSKYFLQDQLRCSDAVADFHSVRSFIDKASSFSSNQAFQFQTQTVRIRIDKH